MKFLSILLAVIVLFVYPVTASAETLAELQQTVKQLKEERTATERQAKALGEQFDASNNKEQLVGQLEGSLSRLESIKAGIDNAEQKIKNGKYESKETQASPKQETGFFGFIWLSIKMVFEVIWILIVAAVMMWPITLILIVICIIIAFLPEKKKSFGTTLPDNAAYTGESFYAQENSIRRNQNGDMGTYDSKGDFTRLD